MPNQQLDHELAMLEAEVLLLGGAVETAIFKAITALRARDLDASQRVIDEDDRIDDMENAFQLNAVEQIRRQAPLAADLRRIIAMMFIANELERIGDYAEGIAKMSLKMGYEVPLKQMDDLPRMGDLAVSMMKRSIETVATSDPDRASEIALGIEEDDDEVDRLYAQMQSEIFELLRADPDVSERATYLLWAAHNIERIADRSTNIAERAIYIAKGVLVGGSKEAVAVLRG